MAWKIVLVAVGTLVAILVAAQLWGAFLYRNLPSDPGTAGDIGPVLHSPLYWAIVAAICIGAGWLLTLWIHAPKS